MIGDRLVGTIAKGENVLMVIKRHPIGLMPIYLTVVFGFVLSLVVFSLLINGSTAEYINIPDGVYAIVFIVIMFIIIVTAFIARSVYWANELIVTDENLIQVLRPTLFSRKVAQLNLAKIQDVSVSQKGFFAMTFRYGTVIIETAGEVASYNFRYAPNPNQLAAEIISAHDEYINRHGIPKRALGQV